MPPKRSKAKQAASASAKKAKIDTKEDVKTQTTTGKTVHVASGSEEPGKTTSQAANDIQTVTVNDKAEFLGQFLVESGWKAALQAEMSSDYFKKMEAEVQKEYLGNPGQVFPPKELIFNALNTTALGKVKVVILGQDPYHDDGQAHGLSFSVPVGVAVPPSLKNIYKELAQDIPGFTIPNHGCLENWAKQGVLLLNAGLTVRAHQPNSHAKIGWQRFTDAIISAISTNSPGCVFILWGGFAQKKDKLIDTKKHHVIKAAHPSPLSVSKFLGCQCFSATNKALEQKGLTSVDWSL